jgi:protein-tyrosine phosphatase
VGLIDLHVHLLPGVDDGPATLDEALAMSRLAGSDGSETLVVTPHQRHELWPNDDRGALQRAFEALQAAVEPAPKLVLGAELRVDSEILAEVDALPGGSLLSLAGSHYLLLEFPSLPGGPEPLDIVHELRIAGWWPVVAHPERIPWLAEDPDLLVALAERGALFELTAMSVAGDFGRRAQACCAFLLDEALAQFVASDAHNATRRAPRLSPAFRTVAERWGEQTARRLFADNPAAVLADRPLPAHS